VGRPARARTFIWKIGFYLSLARQHRYRHLNVSGMGSGNETGNEHTVATIIKLGTIPKIESEVKSKEAIIEL
jgi:hypothetical protein